MRLPRQSATANGATTPGFSGPFPLHSGVFGPPPLFARCSPRWFESTLFGGSLGLVLFGLPARGVMSQPPVTLGRFSGRRPYARSTIARRQEATDPQSPKGGSQRACPTRGAHPTASGRLAVTVRPLSLWVASPGDTSEPPLMIGPWDVALW